MWSAAIALAGGAAAYLIYLLAAKADWRTVLARFGFSAIKIGGRSEGSPTGAATEGRRKARGEKEAPDIGNYSQYSLSAAETAVACMAAAAILFAVAFLFYKNVGVSFVAALTALYVPRIRRKQLIRKRKEELRRQFKHALYSLSSALSAGKSVENAFREAGNDLRMLYPDEKTDMLRELDRVNRRTENGEPVEKSLLDFGRRSGIEDVQQFAEAFAACKRTGGDLVEVMRRTSNLIGEKMEIEQDISVMVAQKRFEAKALGFLPFVIVAFLAFSSPDYMEPLYRGAGHLIMTASLALLGASQWLAQKIMDIGT